MLVYMFVEKKLFQTKNGSYSSPVGELFAELKDPAGGHILRNASAFLNRVAYVPPDLSKEKKLLRLKFW